MGGAARPVAEFLNVDLGKNKRAIQFLVDLLTPQELVDLAIERLMVNCVFGRWVWALVDLDFCYLHGDLPRAVEFKRKYPSAAGTFGVDQHPHMALINLLERAGSPLLHVILCDPMGSDQYSPLHLLRASSETVRHATWLGTQLDSTSPWAPQRLATSGSKSGMYGGDREQPALGVGAFSDLGCGLEPDNLCAFLNREPGLALVAIETLNTRKWSARAAWRPWEGT